MKLSYCYKLNCPLSAVASFLSLCPVDKKGGGQRNKERKKRACVTREGGRVLRLGKSKVVRATTLETH